MSVPRYQAKSELSPHLAMLRRTGPVVVAKRDGYTVESLLSASEVADLLPTAHRVLTPVPLGVGQGLLLAELRLEHAT